MEIETYQGKINLNDVDFLYKTNISHQNGLCVMAEIKKELVSFQNSRHKEADEYGTVNRKYNNKVYHIRKKDFPKLVKSVMCDFGFDKIPISEFKSIIK